MFIFYKNLYIFNFIRKIVYIVMFISILKNYVIFNYISNLSGLYKYDIN